MDRKNWGEGGDQGRWLFTDKPGGCGVGVEKVLSCVGILASHARMTMAWLLEAACPPFSPFPNPCYLGWKVFPSLPSGLPICSLLFLLVYWLFPCDRSDYQLPGPLHSITA